MNTRCRRPRLPRLMAHPGLLVFLLLGLLSACSQPVDRSPAPDSGVLSTTSSAPLSDAEADASAATAVPEGRCVNYSEERLPLFGDLHVHTSLSFDAAAISTGATPADANRFARGEAIPFFPIGDDGTASGQATIDRPLDFLAVTDHGEFLGERALCSTDDSPVYDSTYCTSYRADQRQGMMMFGTVITTETPQRISAICGDDDALCLEYARSPWQQIQQAANAANEPCDFTSFIAYEYTGTPGTSNYHRNVIFRGSAVPTLPVSYVDAPIDSELWAGLDRACSADDGCDYLTIPHNSNLANGRMAPYMKLAPTRDNKIAYARKRQQREPIMEIFQHKGGSECVNGLSSILGAPDELCDVEAVRRIGENKTYTTRTLSDGALRLGTASEVTTECAPGTVGANGMLGAGCVDPTDFQRSGLTVGLAEEQAIGINPIKLGIIASTDTHSATPGAVSENQWAGAVTGESNPTDRLQPGLLTSGIDGNPGGLAGVWATENTRDAIFAAMQRREVFGTSGPRIIPRLFAGWNLPANLCDDPDRVSRAYAEGVPMGSDLPAAGRGKPKFFATAAQDPAGQGLQQLQLIKGWVDQQGQMHNAVLPLVEAAEPARTLCTVFEDQEFETAVPAYYYLRVVEPPTRRWHTYDCAALAEDERPAVCSNGAYPATVQEMAWTSPIWYRPAGELSE